MSTRSLGSRFARFSRLLYSGAAIIKSTALLQWFSPRKIRRKQASSLPPLRNSLLPFKLTVRKSKYVC